MSAPFSLDELARQMVIGALDTLACALTEGGHIWTEGERAIYEQATGIMGVQESRFIETDDDPSEDWKKPDA